MVQWCFVVGEDRCIHMTRDGKDLGRVADVKVVDHTKCLIAVSFNCKVLHALSFAVVLLSSLVWSSYLA